MADRLSTHLLDISTLIEKKQTLEAGLQDIAARAAQALGVARCSVMMVIQAPTGPMLRVCSHFGNLPAAAYAQAVPLENSIAGRAVTSGTPLLETHVQDSPLAGLAHQGAAAGDSLMCAPVRVGEQVIAVLNVSQPIDGRQFSETDMDLLIVFAMMIGKSIQIFELQHMCESRLLQMAQILDRRARGGPIAPDPAQIAKVVAKGFYRELMLAGFGPKAIIAVATEVLGQLNENLDKHRTRLGRDSGDKGLPRPSESPGAGRLGR